MQTGIIRQGKQTFNKRAAFEDKPGEGGSWEGGCANLPEKAHFLNLLACLPLKCGR